jgi:hypothetical protein
LGLIWIRLPWNAFGVKQSKARLSLIVRLILLVISISWLAPGALTAAGIELKRLPQTKSLDRALGLAHAGDGSGRLFIILQTGEIFIHDGTQRLSRPFLDVSDRIACCNNEQGLMSLAFHPSYVDNGELFITYVASNGDGVLSRFSVSGDPNRVDAGSEEVLLRVDQPFANHNLGQLAFAPDGLLYVGSGDGGSAGDPNGNGQDLGTLRGAILRLDVDSASPYAIPADNPFVGDANAQDEIWAYGLRNPWRFSFDRRTGDLFIGDVGQDDFEEVNFEPANSSGGRNFGWKAMEGSACFEPATDCDDGSMTLPIIEYSHDEGCSVTGGYRYRGPTTPTLPRFYIYGDFCQGKIWGALRNGAGRWQSNLLRTAKLRITSFGEDEEGNVYVIDFGGEVFQIVGRHLFASDFESGKTNDWSERSGRLETVSPGLRGSATALEVPADGTSTARYLKSNEPSNETTFAAGFDLNVNQVGLGDEEIEIFRLVGDDGGVLVLTLDRPARKYRLNLYALENDGELRFVGRTKVKKAKTVTVGVEWTEATGAENADGEALLLVRGRVKARAFNLDNSGQRVEETLIGVPSGAAGTTSGAFLIDNYTSTP